MTPNADSGARYRKPLNLLRTPIEVDLDRHPDGTPYEDEDYPAVEMVPYEDDDPVVNVRVICMTCNDVVPQEWGAKCSCGHTVCVHLANGPNPPLGWFMASHIGSSEAS